MSRCAWTSENPMCLWRLEGILSCEECVSTKVIALCSDVGAGASVGSGIVDRWARLQGSLVRLSGAGS